MTAHPHRAPIPAAPEPPRPPMTSRDVRQLIAALLAPWLIPLLLVAACLAGCGGGDGDDAPADAPAKTTPPAPDCKTTPRLCT